MIAFIRSSPAISFLTMCGWGGMLFMAFACSESPIRYFPRRPKSGIRLAVGEQRSIFDACGGSHNKMDSGRPIHWDDDIVGCWDQSTKTIYAEDSCRGAKAAASHEPAHVEGVKNPSKDGYDWK